MKKTVITLLVAFSLVFSVANAEAVNIIFPKFAVNVNQQKIDNTNNLYPIIVYKDISYFPMTYKHARFLGLSADWDKKSRSLTVQKNNAKGDYFHYSASSKSQTNLAYLPNFKIIVNGKAVDNKSEKYPLLVYNNITYFPLTWRFCHDEFGWQYNFSQQNGLVINSDNNNNGKTTTNQQNKIDIQAFNQGVNQYSLTTKIGTDNYLIGKNRDTLTAAIAKIEDDKAVVLKNSKLNASNIILDEDKVYFINKYDTKKTINCIDLVNLEEKELLTVECSKWDPLLMTVLNGNIYYKTSNDNSALFNQNSEKLNQSGALTGLRRLDNYVLATFDAGDGLLVFDQNQKIVTRIKGNINIKSVEISNNIISFEDVTQGKKQAILK